MSGISSRKNPDNDRLVYAVSYRAEDETAWKTLKYDLLDNSYLHDAEVFADGRYYFRVVASDRLANPPSTARDAELLSQPVLIDQTPPRVTLSNQRRNGNAVEIDVEATDDASPIRRAEFSLNGSVWRLMEPADGITDGRTERFAVRFIAVSAEVSVVVRVFDAAGNPGLTRAVVR